ncbi:MAG TPA: hypothetical protein VGM75_21160 [Pseudonocardiaceae bacterium]
MDTEQFSDALRAAAETIEISPGFAQRVRLASQRRQRRHWYRTGVAGVATVALVIVGVGFGTGWIHDASRPAQPSTATPSTVVTPVLTPNDPRLAVPTRGDLAGNAAFLDEVRQVWQDEDTHLVFGPNPNPDVYGLAMAVQPTGQGHVYWAGNTPAGPVGIVLQRFTATRSAPQSIFSLGDGVVSLSGPGVLAGQHGVEIGLVGTDPTSHQTHLLAVQLESTPYWGPDQSFAFGPNDDTLLVLQESANREYAPGPVIDPKADGAGESWSPLHFIDGVALQQIVGPNASGATVALSPPFTQQGVSVGHGTLRFQISPSGPNQLDETYGAQLADLGVNYPDDKARAYLSPWLPWTMNIGLNGADSNSAEWPKLFNSAVFGKTVDGMYSQQDAYTQDYIQYHDQYHQDRNQDGPLNNWTVAVRLANGNTAVLSQIIVGARDELYVVTGYKSGLITTAYGGAIDLKSPLPVRYQLPDGQGWVVAADNATLRAVGSSAPGQQNAALFPANTSAVQVTPKGQAPVTVNLNP